VNVVVNVPQAVADHGVDDLAVAHAITGPGFVEQVGGAGHVLRPARDDHLRVAAHDRLRREHDRLKAGAAYLVHRRGAGGWAEARTDGCLAGDVLPETGAHDVAENHFVYLLGIYRRLGQRAFDRRAAQGRRRYFRKRAAEGPDWRAYAPRQNHRCSLR
jgi:hypothetical protein